MQLLVSVRSADEVEAAVSGGADIIDAKEPNRGSLGAVDRSVLGEIITQVSDRHGFSVALGDLSTEHDVSAALTGTELPRRLSPTYVKLGFARVREPNQIQHLIQVAVSGAATGAAAPQVIAAAYADWERAGTVPPEEISEIAAASGAAGMLLDTYGKDGLGLLYWMTPAKLADWVAISRQAGLLSALAGGLGSGDFPAVCQFQPDVIGVRGAVCSGGRRGRVSAERVQQVHRALLWAVQGISGSEPGGPVGETQDTGAISYSPTLAKSRKLKA